MSFQAIPGIRETRKLARAILIVSLAIEISGCGSGAPQSTPTPPRTLTSVSITPPNPSVALGNTEQFMATGTFSDGKQEDMTQAVTWSSEPTEVAIVTSSGLATSKKIGTTTIKAVSGSLTASTALTVSAATLVSMVVNPPNPLIARGTMQQLSAIGIFSDRSTQDMTESAVWSVSPPGLASVSQTGLAKGNNVGTAKITATSGTVSGTDNLTISSATLIAIAVRPPNPSIPKGMTFQFSATGTFSDGSTQDMTNSAAWTASPPSVATVSNTGLATAGAVGKATITAGVGSLRSNDTLTVLPAILVSIAVTPANPSISLGFKQQFSASGTFSDGTTQDVTRTVNWKTDHPGVATISSFGLATSRGIGSSGVTATLGSVTGSDTLGVTPPVLVSIAVTPNPGAIAVGTAEQIAALGTFSDGSTADFTSKATWTSTQPKVASVTPGWAVGRGQGVTTITAAVGSLSASARLTVSAPALSLIVVTPANVSIHIGGSVQLTATGIFTDGHNQDLTNAVRWTTSPKNVATVSNTGLATGQGPGAATILAESGPLRGTDTLIVSVVSLAIAPADASIPLGSALQLRAVGTFSDGTTHDLTTAVTWNSKDTSVATVTPSGLAVSEAVGTTTLSATTSTSLSASSNVNVQPLIVFNYFSNANVAGSPSAEVNLSNTVIDGNDLCAMFYVFDDREEMNECCGCPVSQDDLRTSLVNDDLTSNPLTGIKPTRGVIEIVPASLASNPSCDPSSFTPEGVIAAWTSHLQDASPAPLAVTETSFQPEPLGSGKQSILQTLCAGIKTQGGGHGICSCGSGH